MTNIFDLSHFNTIDYIFLAVIVLSTITSFFRGFVREALSLIVWVLGTIMALKFAPTVQPSILSLVHVNSSAVHVNLLSYVVAFALIFIAVWFVGVLISLIIRSILSRVGLGPLDRVLGLFFGIARGLLVVSVVMMFVDASSYQQSNLIRSSVLAPHFKGVAEKLGDFIPQDMKRLTMDWKMSSSDGES